MFHRDKSNALQRVFDEQARRHLTMNAKATVIEITSVWLNVLARKAREEGAYILSLGDSIGYGTDTG